MKNRIYNISDIPRGFYYFENFLSEVEEKQLLAKIQNLHWQEVKMHGKVAKRRVMHFGLDYTYASKKVHPTTPIPKFLDNIIQRASGLLELPYEEVVEVLITEYSPGAGIGWHKDAAIFGDKVFGISLASMCVMKLRQANERDEFKIYQQVLAPRSAYIISGEARNKWYHHIPPVKTLRYSITFRTL